jgi:hypothetical protein
MKIELSGWGRRVWDHEILKTSLRERHIKNREEIYSLFQGEIKIKKKGKKVVIYFDARRLKLHGDYMGTVEFNAREIAMLASLFLQHENEPRP